MDVAEAIHRRRAYRVFDPRPVEEETVSALVEAMRLAPSCNNMQPWRVVICSGEALTRVKEALTKGNVWATVAPLILVVAGKPADDCRANEGRDYFKFGCGLAVGEMVLRATELGLIAHPIGGFDPIRVREALDIPIDYVVITLIICGYPGTDESLLSDKQKAQQRERPERKPVWENFFRDGWEKPIADQGDRAS
jgi:nitroreductase